MALCRSEVIAGPFTPLISLKKRPYSTHYFLGEGTLGGVSLGGEVVLVYNEQRLAIFPTQMSNKVAVELEPVDALGSLSTIPIRYHW